MSRYDPRRALVRANEIRIARAEVKAQILRGEVTVAELLRNPPESIETMEILDLLVAQRRWGRGRAAKVLSRLGISQTRAVSETPTRSGARPTAALTARQRLALAERLEELARLSD